MPAQWTADLVGEMHLHKISALRLAKEVGWNPKYLSTVLNGHRTPAGAEKKLRDAMARMIEKEE